METSRPRYFTPAEVSSHDTVDDLWVSCLGKVCDLSPLVDRYRGEAPPPTPAGRTDPAAVKWY